MALPIMHGDDEDELRAARGLPPRPRPAMPGAAPPGPALPARAAPAPSAAPPRPDVAVPATDPAASRTVRAAVTPPAPRRPDPLDEPVRRPSQGWGALVHAIAMGLQGKPSDHAMLQGLDQQAVDDRRRAIAAAEKDPASERSAKLRQSMSPMLRQLGLTDDEIGTLSAADIAQMTQGGELARAVSGARQKAAAAKAKAEADQAALLEQRGYEEQRDKAKREADAAEWDRQNAITAPQSLERARAVGGMATDRMVQGAVLQDELSARRAAENDARDAANRAAAAAAEEERRVAGELRKAEAADAKELEALNAMEARLQRRADQRLPGQKGIVDSTVTKGMAYVGGGTGMSDEDSRLDNDLTALGLQSYINTAGNAPNSEREQDVANRTFRGDGSTASAIAAIQTRKQQIARLQEARRNAAQGNRVGQRPTAQQQQTPGWKDLGGGKKRVKVNGQRFKATPAQIQQMVADGVAVEEIE